MRSYCLPCVQVALALSFTMACSSSGGTGGSGTAAGGTAATTAGSSSGGTSALPGAGSSTGGSVASSGAASGGQQGTAGASASGGESTVGGGGTGGAGMGGDAGSGGMSTAGSGGMSMGPGGGVRTGMSTGCGKPPPGDDSSQKYVLHEVHITGLDPVYMPGGMYYKTSGPYNPTFRPYAVRLPNNYDPTKPYAVTFGGGGCGGSAQNFAGNPGGGLQIAGNGNTIQVGLSYIETCFADGGPAIGNRPDTPDEPYFRTIMAEIEANYCIDLSQVFVAGSSSGAWEAYTLGCAASDLIRGIGTDEGGMRMVHPECKGPVAAVLVAGEADTENPIGPLDPNNDADKGAIGRLGSLGSAPGRDDILMRNGCNGSATAPYGDPYSACVKYTGCPANYPVIWCALPGVGHNASKYNGTEYSPGPMWDVLGKLPPP